MALLAGEPQGQAKLRRTLTLGPIVVSGTAAFRNRLRHLQYRVREFFDTSTTTGQLLDYGKRQPLSTNRGMDRGAMTDEIRMRRDKLPQWSIDRVEQDVGDEAIEAGVYAGRALTEYIVGS